MISPISNNKLKPFIECKDHLVTNEKFSILIDEETELLVTNPQPTESEINKYYESEEYNSHSEKSNSLFDKIYEFVRVINIKNKYSIIEKNIDTKGNILDIGCGTGDFLEFCKSKKWNIHGIEPNKKAREISEKKINIDINPNTSIKKLPDESFDVITMWHVLEHRYDIIDTIKNLKRIIKPNGIIIIALPNYKSFDAKYYKRYWAAYDVPRHLFHFSRKTIDYIFQKNNLFLKKTYPMYFDAFYVSMISEKNKTKKLNPIKAIFIGFISNLFSLFSKESSSLIYIAKKI